MAFEGQETTSPLPSKPLVEEQSDDSEETLRAVGPLEPVPVAPKDAKWVTYHGQASLRTITEEQWLQGGIEGQSSVTWRKETGNRVRVDEFTEAALDVLRIDGSFSVPASDTDEDGDDDEDNEV